MKFHTAIYYLWCCRADVLYLVLISGKQHGFKIVHSSVPIGNYFISHNFLFPWLPMIYSLFVFHILLFAMIFYRCRKVSTVNFLKFGFISNFFFLKLLFKTFKMFHFKIRWGNLEKKYFGLFGNCHVGFKWPSFMLDFLMNWKVISLNCPEHFWPEISGQSWLLFLRLSFVHTWYNLTLLKLGRSISTFQLCSVL